MLWLLLIRGVGCQFWYTDDTALSVAKAVAHAAANGSIACVACPSLFRALRSAFPVLCAHLFEFDPRFEALGSFSLYDYREPRSVAPELHHAFDVVVADPPYLVSLSIGISISLLLCDLPKKREPRSVMPKHAFDIAVADPPYWVPPWRERAAAAPCSSQGLSSLLKHYRALV